MAYIEMGTQAMRAVSNESDCLAELSNNFDFPFAMVYARADVKDGHTLVLFSYMNGIRAHVGTNRTNRNLVHHYNELGFKNLLQSDIAG